MKNAFVFPGQGAQYIGMAQDFYDNFDIVRSIFEEASDITKIDIKKIIFDSTEKELKQTVNTQPAIITVELSIYEIMKREFGITPYLAAGHSVGEASALYVAGIVSKADAFGIIGKRAFFMEREAKKTNGKMFAVLGMKDETLNDYLSRITEGIVVAANYNTIGQIVVSGDEKGTKALLDLFEKNNERIRTIELKVSGGWHSPLMEGAYNEYSEFLDGIEFHNSMEIKYVSNVSGEYETSGDKIKKLVSRQIISPVLWTRTMRKMVEGNIQNSIEIGPGSVLSGLMKRYDRSINRINIEKISDLEKLKEVL